MTEALILAALSISPAGPVIGTAEFVSGIAWIILWFSAVTLVTSGRGDKGWISFQSGWVAMLVFLVLAIVQVAQS